MRKYRRSPSRVPHVMGQVKEFDPPTSRRYLWLAFVSSGILYLHPSRKGRNESRTRHGRYMALAVKLHGVEDNLLTCSLRLHDRLTHSFRIVEHVRCYSAHVLKAGPGSSNGPAKEAMHS